MMIQTLFQSRALYNKKRLSVLLAVLFVMYADSYAQNGIVVDPPLPHPTITRIDLGGTISSAATLTIGSSGSLLIQGSNSNFQVAPSGRVGIGTTPSATITNLLSINGDINLVGISNYGPGFYPEENPAPPLPPLDPTGRMIFGYNGNHINLYNTNGGLLFSPLNANSANSAVSRFRGPLMVQRYFTVTGAAPIGLDASDNKVKATSPNAYVQLYEPANGNMNISSQQNMNFYNGMGHITNNPNPFFGIWNYTWNSNTSGTTSVETMRLTQTGSLGIGVTNPTQKLEVAGKIKTIDLQVTNPSPDPASILHSGYILASKELIPSTGLSDGTVEWRNPADLGGIKWTARKLGILPTSVSSADQRSNLLAALARPDIHTIWFEGDLGSVYAFSGAFDCGGKVLKFENGNMLKAFGAGHVTLTNVIIDASNESHIFDQSIDLQEGPGVITTAHGWVSVKWYGATGDAATDDQPAIQKAIDMCTRTHQMRLIIPKGSYKLNAPLVVRPFSNEWASLHISGESYMWGEHGTTLYPSFNNTFVIGLQLAKGCKVSNLTIIGKFVPPPYDQNDISSVHSFINRDFDSQFDDQAETDITKKARDRRYSPYSAIVIDPFTNSTVPSGQVDPNFPSETGQATGYPGMESYYGVQPGRGGSEAIEIEDVAIGGFVVGITCSPNGETLLNDVLKISRTKIINCKLSVSGSQSQEKTNVIDGLAITGRTHTIFATGKYGIPNQSGNWHISNVNIALAVRFIDNQQQDWYPAHIDNVYGEAIGSFGIINSRSTHSISNGTEVSNCVFNFMPYNTAGYQKLAETDGGVTFKNCTFRYYNGYPRLHPATADPIHQQPWKEHSMMVFDCAETLFEDCKFSGVPVQHKEMGPNGYQFVNTYKNCTASKYTFGQNVFRNALKIGSDPSQSTGEDNIEHNLFYNNFKAQSLGQQDWGASGFQNILETYQFEGKEVFVNFHEKNPQLSVTHTVQLTDGTVTYYVDENDPANPGHTHEVAHTQYDATQQYTQIVVDNTDAYYVGGLLVFNAVANFSYFSNTPVGYGLITAIDEGTHTLSVSYISPQVQNNGQYKITCLYAAEQCGSFMGNITYPPAPDPANPSHRPYMIERVAADRGATPPEYVGHLIKCPYNWSWNGGWTKIVNYTPGANANDGVFEILGNGGGGFFPASNEPEYFNNGATKTIESTKASLSLGTPTSPGSNRRTMIVYKGEKLIEKELTDARKESVCVKTGYTNLSPSLAEAVPAGEDRLACWVEVSLPACENTGTQERPARSEDISWNLKGNSIIASAKEKGGLDSSDAAADADTSQFLGTTNKVSLRIRTGNKERMVVDKNGTVMIGGVDVNTISNHKDPKENYLFAVKGNAIFERAVVKLSTSWPDYVFDDKYALLPLAELEVYIKQNKHLPGLPSAEEVQGKGIDLGNNQAVLLNKLEEMTLYMIEQNKKAEEQNRKIDVLEKQNVQLLEVQKQIDELKKKVSNHELDNR